MEKTSSTMRVSLPPKKIKIQGGKKERLPHPNPFQTKGTTTGYYLNFIIETLDIMDRYPQTKGFYLIMNNARIHSSSEVNQMLENRKMTINVYIFCTLQN